MENSLSWGKPSPYPSFDVYHFELSFSYETYVIYTYVVFTCKNRIIIQILFDDLLFFKSFIGA